MLTRRQNPMISSPALHLHAHHEARTAGVRWMDGLFPFRDTGAPCLLWTAFISHLRYVRWAQYAPHDNQRGRGVQCNIPGRTSQTNQRTTERSACPVKRTSEAKLCTVGRQAPHLRLHPPPSIRRRARTVPELGKGTAMSRVYTPQWRCIELDGWMDATTDYSICRRNYMAGRRPHTCTAQTAYRDEKQGRAPG